MSHDSRIHDLNVLSPFADRPTTLGDAPPPNGFKNWGSFAQIAPKNPAETKDIANKEVRPEVYYHVHDIVSPVAWGRFREPREKSAPEVKTWDDGPAPKPKPEQDESQKDFVPPEEPD